MRVAIITETFLPKVDGIVKVTCLLLDHLSKRGIEALVIAPRYGEDRRYNDVPVAERAELVVSAVSGGASGLRQRCRYIAIWPPSSRMSPTSCTR